MRALCILFFIVFSSASALAQGAPVKGMRLYSDMFVCDNTNHHYQWTSPAVTTIVEARVWFGLTFGAYSDIAALLLRTSDNSILMDAGHDHYANTIGFIVSQNWGGNVVVIQPGDTVTFDMSCSPGNMPGHFGAFVVTIWTK